MYTVYVLCSARDGNLYIGQTNDLRKRLMRHSAGYVKSTKHRRPLQLIYTKEFDTRVEAMKYEKYLKSGAGHQYINHQIGRHIPR